MKAGQPLFLLDPKPFEAQLASAEAEPARAQAQKTQADREAMRLKPLAERRAIGQFLDGAVDLEDVVDRTVRLLSTLTRQVAIVQYPSLTRSTVRHLELVGLGATRVLLVLIADTGRVEQRVVETSAPVSDDL
ncbi:MAG TPA: hypothetical protein PKX44_01635, partial [Methanomassiliicoccaceae archaeon]|nr:hypothetical protein [Methanomassiliicoccaceae archaeon]